MNPFPSIKTPDEIAIMRRAGHILQQVLSATCARAKAGVTTRELDAFAEKMIREMGGTPGFKGYKGFPASICTSVNDQVVHGIPSDTPLKDGDIVGIDAGVYLEGFHTDACRTVLVGSPEPSVRHFVKTTQQALKQGLKEVREGAYTGDISAMIQKVLERQGYSPVIECTGHGVGRNLHEPPDIFNAGHRSTGTRLQAGMTIAVEPIAVMGSPSIRTLPDRWTIVTKDGGWSAHFEHTVLVTREGYDLIA